MKLYNLIILIDLLKCDNTAAFKELYSRYKKVLYDIAYKKLKDKDDAQDIVHDLFLQIWNSRASLDTSMSFEGFLFISLKNKMIDKQRLATIRLSKYDEIANFPTQYTDTIYEQIYYNELNNFLKEQINQLPERTREIYCLSHQDNLSIEEIAIRLSISGQTVKNQLVIAKKRLRKKTIEYISEKKTN